MLAAVRAGNRFLMGTNAFRLPASSSRCIHMAPKLPMGEHAGFTFAHSYRCYSAGSGIREITTEEDLQGVIKASPLVAIDFYASWCGPCQMIAPVFKRLSEEFPNIAFIKADSDKAGPLAHKFGVSSIPHFVFLKDGKEVSNLIGANKNELKAKLESLK